MSYYPQTYSFEKIIAWQKAHSFVLYVYEVTKLFPSEEKFGLTSQFRRAEGYKKLGRQDKLRFMNIEQGSSEECRDYIILSRDLEYIYMEQYQQLHNKIEETSKLLNAYCRGIANNHAMTD